MRLRIYLPPWRLSNEIWRGLWSLEGVWPLSPEFTAVLAILILPWVGYLLGYQTALEAMK